VVARAHAVIHEVERVVVKYSVIYDEVVLRHISVESRKYGDVGRGDDDDTTSQRDVIDETGLTTRVVREHPIRPKHDVVTTSDHDAHAG